MTGSVSQNWVRRRAPPGALKQQESDLETAVVFWQLSGRSEGQDSRAAYAPAVRVRVRARYFCMVNVYVVVLGGR